METVWKTLNYVTILILCHDFCNEFVCVCVCLCVCALDVSLHVNVSLPYMGNWGVTVDTIETIIMYNNYSLLCMYL